MKKAGCGGMGVGLFFALFWCGMTFFADGAILTKAGQQLRTNWFASTTGTVTRAEVKIHHGKSTSYKPEVSYRYQVAATDYESQRIRFDQIEPGQKKAEAIVARYPVNQPVTVYYDASAPQTSALERDLSPGTFFAMLFLAPFNALAFAFVGGAFLWWRGKVTGSPSAGAGAREDGFHTTIYVYKISPALVALAAWGATGFVGTFVVLLASNVMPQAWAVAFMWVLLVLVPMVAWWQARKRYFQIRRDALRGVFEVRDFDGSLIQINEQDLQPATWKMRSTRDSKGRNVERFPVKIAFVDAVTNQSRTVDLGEQTSEEEAQRFVSWFNQRMFPR